jgi:hypothetical protein
MRARTGSVFHRLRTVGFAKLIKVKVCCLFARKPKWISLGKKLVDWWQTTGNKRDQLRLNA